MSRPIRGCHTSISWNEDWPRRWCRGQPTTSTYDRSGLLPPRHASPGLNAWGSTEPSLSSCPYDCETPPGPFSGFVPFGSSFFPEKTQIEFACSGPAVGVPFPVTSPANAEPAPTAATATAQSAAATRDLSRIAYLPCRSELHVDASLASWHETIRAEARRQPAIRPGFGRRAPDLAKRPTAGSAARRESLGQSRGRPTTLEALSCALPIGATPTRARPSQRVERRDVQPERECRGRDGREARVVSPGYSRARPAISTASENRSAR
jgi:hypothetical protein